MTQKPVKIGRFTENVKIRDEQTGQQVQLTPYELRRELKRLTRSGNPAVRSQAMHALGIVEVVGAHRRRR